MLRAAREFPRPILLPKGISTTVYPNANSAIKIPYISEATVTASGLRLVAHPTVVSAPANTTLRVYGEVADDPRLIGFLTPGDASITTLAQFIASISRIGEGTYPYPFSAPKKLIMFGPRSAYEAVFGYTADGVSVWVRPYAASHIELFIAEIAERSYPRRLPIKERAEEYTREELLGYREVVKENDVEALLSSRDDFTIYLVGDRGAGKTFMTMLACMGKPTVYILMRGGRILVRNPRFFTDKVPPALEEAYARADSVYEILSAVPRDGSVVVVLDDVHYMFERGYSEAAAELVEIVAGMEGVKRIIISDVPVENYLIWSGKREAAYNLYRKSIKWPIISLVKNRDIAYMLLAEDAVNAGAFLKAVFESKGMTYRQAIRLVSRIVRVLRQGSEKHR